jgi:hypothetical protein
MLEVLIFMILSLSTFARSSFWLFSMGERSGYQQQWSAFSVGHQRYWDRSQYALVVTKRYQPRWAP